MFCKYCGKEIDNDSKVCKYCGKNVSDSGVNSSAAPICRSDSATTSLVLGISAIVCCLIGFWVFGFPLSVTAIVLSVVGLPFGIKAVRSNPAGMILSIVGIIAGIVELCATIAILS